MLLAIVVMAAAAGRFTALGWGLRHLPEPEEQMFVENVRQMLVAGDLDHRFYEYPALFFYILAPAVAAAEPAQGSAHLVRDGVAAGRTYLAARAVVAAFGVASCVLVFLLGRQLMDDRAALLAAALLAVSPFEIETAHTVRPDVVLETFVLLALLAFRRTGGRLRDDAVAGVALGAAAAVKFTGGLLVPVYLLSRWLSPGPRVQGTLVAGLVSMATWLVLTPYAVLKTRAFLGGTADQWNYHYRTGEVASHFTDIVGYYLAAHQRGLGVPAAVLVFVGLAATLPGPRRREWIPLVAWPVTLMGVLSTADMRYGRLCLSDSCVQALLAAAGALVLARWRPRPAAALGLVALAAPAVVSLKYLRDVGGIIPSDEAVAWIDAHVPPRATILCRLEWLGIDPRRFEVLRSNGFPHEDRLAAAHADFIVDGARDPLFGDLAPLYATERISTFNGDRLVVREVPAARRRRDRELPLEGVKVTGSSNSAEAAAVVDGRIDAAWSTEAPQAPGDWLQIDLTGPVWLGRVELMIGGKLHRAAQEVRLWVRDEAGGWHRVSHAHARPPVEEQPPKGRSQVLVFEPVRTAALRIEQTGRGKTRWSVAELRLGAADSGRKYDAATAE